MPGDDARAEKSEKEALSRRTALSRGNVARAKLAEPTNGASPANAVADFGRARSHDVLTPGTH
jgi:hypothetical protein